MEEIFSAMEKTGNPVCISRSYSIFKKLYIDNKKIPNINIFISICQGLYKENEYKSKGKKRARRDSPRYIKGIYKDILQSIEYHKNLK